MLKVDLTAYVEKHEFCFDAVLNEHVTNDEVTVLILQIEVVNCCCSGTLSSHEFYCKSWYISFLVFMIFLYSEFDVWGFFRLIWNLFSYLIDGV